ncbi:MAG: DUF58 domain-containing protein [Actinobacteria bacterium]|nr:DUF58 domain-containing protein [Actinomycetota bacterium]
MKRSAAPKLRVYPALAAIGMLAGLALGRPELVALAAPFAVLVAIGVSLAQEPELTARLVLDAERQVEGEEVLAEVEVSASRPVERLTGLLVLPAGLRTEGPNPFLVRLASGGRRSLELPLECERWGAYGVGRVLLRAQDALGFLVLEASFDLRQPLKVYPGGESLSSLLRPLETQVFSGNQVARVRADGIEFADLRPFVAGDRVRRVNWRATARRGVPWVNESHPERNSDVVIFLDTFAEARRGAAGTLDASVRAAAALAELYLREKDRVGIVSFGGVLNWLTVSSGPVQLYRIVDSLLDAEIWLSYVWKDLEVIPTRTLPPRALVLALSPLLDDRAIGALADLRSRGFDLAILEVSPLPYVEPGETESERLAFRVWQLRREAIRSRYRSLGVPVVEWRDHVPLEAAIEEVRRYRRHARTVRA